MYNLLTQKKMELDTALSNGHFRCLIKITKINVRKLAYLYIFF